MANITDREVKRFHEHRNQITFAYAQESQSTTLLVVIETPNGAASLSLDRRQTQALCEWLEEQVNQR